MSARSRAKYDRAYRRKNHKRITAYARAWRHKNPEYSRTYCKAWRRTNSKRVATYTRAWRRTNSKRVATYTRAWRRKNHKRMLAQYEARNRSMRMRHAKLLGRHKYQLAPRGVTGRPISLEEHRKKIYYADGRDRSCWYCLGENNKTGSGLDRLHNNVTYTVKNTVPSCRGCNVWRGSTHTVQETRDHFKPMRDAARRGETTR
jgi:hypothetical protein